MKLGDIKDNVWYGSEDNFTIDNQDGMFWVVSVSKEPIKATSLNEVVMKKITDEEIDDTLQCYGWIYDRERKVLHIEGDPEDIQVEGDEEIKFCIAEMLGLHGPSTFVESFDYDNVEKLNQILSQYEIPHEFEERYLNN